MEPNNIEVCCGGMCMMNGSDEIYETLQKEFDHVEMCQCLGRCDKGPNVLVDETRVLHHAKPTDIAERIKHGEGEEYKRFSEDEITDDFLGDI